MRNIVLIGFMGTGKTAVAKALSKTLGIKYVSTDDLIEKKEGISIRKIFSKNGESYFRIREKNVVKSVVLMKNVVVDTGGGVCIDAQNMESLKQKCTVICLWAEPEVILKRTRKFNYRPLLNVADPLNKIKELLAYRKQFYDKADYHISTSGLNVEEVVSRIEKVLKTTNETNAQLKQLYERFSSETKPVHKAYLQSIHSLVNLAEARDPYTKRHSVKVSNYAVLLARAANLPEKDIENIRLAAILHDIGKIGIKEKILLKNGSLTSEEYEEVKKHPELGMELLKPLKFFNQVVELIKYHHENYDGSGYPSGLKGKDIPIASRILSIADVYDALTSKRSYREAYTNKEALRIMIKESGKKYDPILLKIFMDCLRLKEEKSANKDDKKRQ